MSSVLSSSYRKRSLGGKKPKAKKTYVSKPFRTPGFGPKVYCRQLPERMKCKLTYVAIKELNTTTGLAAPTVFKGNGIWDPDPAAGGNQPNNFDQMMGLYTNWFVSGSRIKMRVIASQTNASPIAPAFGNATIVVLPYRSNSAITPARGQYQQIGMLAHAQTKYLNSTVRAANFNRYCNQKKMFSWNADDLANNGDSANDPTSVWNWLIYCWASEENTAAATASQLTYLVKIEYDVTFYCLRANLD